jgi:RimJ/RimL family protein N-acetyltransferase
MNATTLALPIETQRLTLRWYRPGDIDALIDLQRREDVITLIPWEQRSREKTIEWLQSKISVQALETDGDYLTLAVEKTADRVYVGEVLLFLVSRQHLQGEVGYVFHPDYQRRGYATEATAAVIDAGFDSFGLHRIRARLDARNEASARLCERLGMRREAHLIENELHKGVWEDELVYAILDREWAARR